MLWRPTSPASRTESRAHHVTCAGSRRRATCMARCLVLRHSQRAIEVRALTGVNAAVVGPLTAALNTPVWTSAILVPINLGIAFVRRESCFQCHEDHAAVEHSFVQFYPTLKPIAMSFGTDRDR